jgi:hypothetical protein
MITKESIYSSLALAGTASLLALSNPTAANALSFNWSFVTDPFATGGAGQTISGTISGLVEGSNPGTGLTVTVDSTPTGKLLGGGWNFIDTTGGDAFTVTAGAVTFADANFERGGLEEQLFFGGFGGYNPELLDTNTGNPDWFARNPNTFTPVGAAATPEPSGLVALLGLGMLGLAGRKLKR